MIFARREPAAKDFYARECRREIIEGYVKGFHLPPDVGGIVAGVVPHAGWVYSGRIAAEVFKGIKDASSPETFILLGAIHDSLQRNSIYKDGSWVTPLGEVEVDYRLASFLLDNLGGKIKDDPRAHFKEHSLEVQLPLIKYFFPEAKIVPIRVAAERGAVSLGEDLARLLTGYKGRSVVIGTSDLTHYGDIYAFAPSGYGKKALKWMKENDERMLDLIINMQAEAIVGEAKACNNACGAGALAATVALARSLSISKGTLLKYATSHGLSRDEDFYMGVGYAGVIFAKR